MIFILNFLIILLISVFLAFSKYRNKAVLIFLSYVILFPSANFLTSTYFKFQIIYFYALFIPLLIIYILRKIRSNKADWRELLIFITISVFILVFTIMFMAGHGGNSFIDYLKDLKSMVILLFAVIFISLFRKDFGGIFESIFWRRLVAVNFIVDSVIFILLYNFRIDTILSNDPYFALQPARYADLGTMVIFVYLVYRFSQVNKNIFDSSFLFAMAPIFYTGNRTLFLILAILALVRFILIGSVARKVYYFAAIVVVGSFIVLVIFQSKEGTAFNRIKSLSQKEKIGAHLENRFTPFYNSFNNSSKYEQIFGRGMGSTFEIPWFHYRPNIDNNNIYLDNLYLTVFSKYGVFSIVLLLVLILLIRFSIPHNPLFYTLIIVSWGILSLTNAIIFLNYSWLLMISPVFARAEKDF